MMRNDNLFFGVGIILLGLLAITTALFALGSLLQWGATLTMEMLR